MDSPKDVATLLRKARVRITDPANHTREVYACDMDGHPVNSLDSTATCWCAVGALKAEGPRGFMLDQAWELLNEEARRHGSTSITGLNDHRTHSEVLRVMDSAIARAETGAAA